MALCRYHCSTRWLSPLRVVRDHCTQPTWHTNLASSLSRGGVLAHHSGFGAFAWRPRCNDPESNTDSNLKSRHQLPVLSVRELEADSERGRPGCLLLDRGAWALAQGWAMDRPDQWRAVRPPSAAAFPFPGNARYQKKHLKNRLSFQALTIARESNGNSGQTARECSSSSAFSRCKTELRPARNPLTNSSSPLTKGTQNVTTKTELGRQLAFAGIHLTASINHEPDQ